MHEILSLHPQGFTSEDADRHYAMDGVRAVAHTPFGSGFGGLVISSRTSLTGTSTSTNSAPPPICVDGTLCGLLIPIEKVPSWIPPLAVNVLSTVTVAGGGQESYADYLTSLRAAPEGVHDASAYVLGIQDVHFLLEVVSDDALAAAKRLMALTAHEAVLDVRTFVTGPEGTRGFGAGLEGKLAATRKAKGAARKRS